MIQLTRYKDLRKSPVIQSGPVRILYPQSGPVRLVRSEKYTLPLEGVHLACTRYLPKAIGA